MYVLTIKFTKPIRCRNCSKIGPVDLMSVSPVKHSLCRKEPFIDSIVS